MSSDVTPSGNRGEVAAGFVDANHVALYVRSVDEAVRFWIDVLGAKLSARFSSGRAFAVDLAGLTLAFFDRKGAGLVGTDNEYPHIAFTVTPTGMRSIRQALNETGARTHQPWTRHRIEALMYFRDPSGNLFELYCPQYDDIESLAVGKGKGGEFRPPLSELSYDWHGSRSA